MSNALTAEDVLERSPFLSNLKRRGRLAPSRLADLLRSAKGPKAPAEPDPWECCGSSCKPCVTTLWKEELRCWKECHPDGEDASEEGPDAEVHVLQDEGVEKGKERERERRADSPKVEIELELDRLSLGGDASNTKG
ncbi:hypothetical protein P7C70_g4050, partial [Phenoliferia sp. Uapishka_3]